MLATTAFCTLEETIDFMKRRCLLAQSATCSACGTAMCWQKCSKLSDGYLWRCPRSACRKKLSIRAGSFFSKSHLSLQTRLKLIYFWATDEPVTKVHQQLDQKECSTKTAIDVFNFLREVCSQHLIALGDIQLGGPGAIVQIDESLFNHKPKYQRGRRPPAHREHTQTIESYWSRAKAKLKVMRGTQMQHLPSYLDEYMWKERFGRKDGVIDMSTVFMNIIGDIATQNPV